MPLFATIDRMYAFLAGNDMLMADPPPDLGRLAEAERELWRRLHTAAFEGESLEAGITFQLTQLLFWWNAVFQPRPPPAQQQHATADGNAQQWSNQSWQTSH